MHPTRQTLFLGNLQAEYQQELKTIREEQLLKRLWAKDTTLWPPEEPAKLQFKANLEFLHIPERLPQILAGALQADSDLRKEGLTDRVVISFGSVYHFCKALSNLCPDTTPLKFIILDSCHPGAIRNVESQVDSSKMLIALVNKTAYRLEDHALFLYFLKKLQSEVPGSAPGRFVGASDAHTFLARTAAEYHFRYFLELPSGIAATYCAAIHVTLLLKVFAGTDLEALRNACREMMQIEAGAGPGPDTPASEIAAFLAATVESGRRFACFLASPPLAPLASALSRLVGGSIGKEGGVFPIENTIPCETEPWENLASFVVFRSGAKQESDVEECIARLRSRSIPFLEITVADPLDLLRCAYRWQIATVLASTRMGLDPFDLTEPRLARTMAAEMLNVLSPQNDSLQRRPRIQEKQIQLFAEARARQEISQLNLNECLVSFLQKRQGASYLGLFVYLDPTDELLMIFTSLREQLAQALKIPVILAWGPRSLDTFGHLFRQNAPQGCYLLVTGEMESDVKIPGANYTFGQMYQAWAIGHFEALSAGGNLALRLHLGSPLAESLDQLQKAVSQALRRGER